MHKILAFGAALLMLAALILLAPIIVLAGLVLAAFFSGFAILNRTCDAYTFNLASFHSPHSLTWSWVLSFIRPRSLEEGRWLGVYGYRSNTGWTAGLQVWRRELHLARQYPTLYRSLFHRLRDRQAGLALTVAVLAAAALVPLDAFAQAVVTNPPSFIDSVVLQLQPIVTTLVVGAAGALALWLGKKFNDLLGVKDANERAANELIFRNLLHAAAENGLKMAFTKLGYAPKPGEPIPADVLKEAIGYVKEKSPEAVEKFNASDRDIGEIVLSKVPDIIGTIAGTFGGGLVGSIAEGVAGDVVKTVTKKK